jgi:hypothetical protein
MTSPETNLPPDQQFIQAVEQQFNSGHDPLCQLKSARPDEESIKLYPTGRYLAAHEVHDVVLTRSTVDIPDLPPRSPQATFVVNGRTTTFTVKQQAIWQIREGDEHGVRGQPAPHDEARLLKSFINGLHDRPATLYLRNNSYSGFDTWSSQFRLPTPQPRGAVLETIHHHVQQSYNLGDPELDPEDVPDLGLEGVLLGPDDDATMVEEVLFMPDPSKRYGQREDSEIDQSVALLTEQQGWIETDESQVALVGWARCILGRNKDWYGGENAFTLEETRDLLPASAMLTLNGGYLFSTRPGWQQPYGEPAAIVKGPYDRSAPIVNKLTIDAIHSLGWAMNRQARLTITTENSNTSYKSNA